MVNDISVLNEWWLVSMPIPMEPQRQAIGNLIDLKSHCGPIRLEDGSGAAAPLGAVPGTERKKGRRHE